MHSKRIAKNLTNGSIPSEIQAALASISERQNHQENDLKLIVDQLKNFIISTENSFKEIREEMRSSAKTPWGIIFSGFSLVISIITVVGALALVPINEKIREIKDELKEVAVNKVSRNELNEFRDRIRIESEAIFLRNTRHDQK